MNDLAHTKYMYHLAASHKLTFKECKYPFK